MTRASLVTRGVLITFGILVGLALYVAYAETSEDRAVRACQDAAAQAHPGEFAYACFVS